MEFHTLKINIGAGSQVIEGWQSLGLEPHHDIAADFSKPLPFEPGSVDALMAIHTFEHLYRWQAVPVLADWFAVLKPGGELVLELPELMRCCRNVLDGAGGERRGVWGLFGDPGYEDPLMTHKWCYSESELRGLLVAAGFRKVRFKEPQFHGRKRLRDIRVECIK